MRPLNNIPRFAETNHFDALQVTANGNDKESNEQLIPNETDSPLLKSIISKTRTIAPTTVILGDSNVKNV